MKYKVWVNLLVLLALLLGLGGVTSRAEAGERPASGSTYTLNIAASPSEGGTTVPAPGAHSYPEGTTVSVSATPNIGWKFDRWTGPDRNECATGSVLMNADKSCTANFKLKLTMAAIPPEGGITVPAPGDHFYAKGTTVSVSATHNTGWKFDGWIGADAAECATGSVVMNDQRFCLATFSIITPPTPANDHWMADLANYIRDRDLARVVLPGTHDSGTYGIKWKSRFAPIDCQDPGIKRGMTEVQEFCDKYGAIPVFWGFCGAFKLTSSALTSPWARAQDQSIADQLAGGVRYFDLRFFKSGDKFKIHHTLVGPDSDDIFDQVENFIRADGHEKEIVILDLGHWCGGMEAEDHKRLVATLYGRFSDLMIPNTMLHATLHDLWVDDLRVLIRYAGFDATYATGGVDPDLFWPNINSEWLQAKDDYDGSILLPKMAARLPSNNHSQLFVLQGVVTPDTVMVSWGLKCTLAPGLWPNGCKDRPTSLRKVAETITPKVSNSVYDWCEDCLHSARDNLNIITVDFYELGPLVQRVKEINQGTYNTAPTVDAGPDLVGEEEGHPVDLQVAFEDRDTCDSHDASVDWGDGTTEDVTVPQGDRQVVSSHTYADNGTYTATVCVRDRFDEACDTLEVTVENVPPEIDATGDTIDENGVATVSGSITDPGILDTFTLVIDWGEGPPEPFSYAAGTTSYSETHHYLDDNPSGTPSDDYTINLSITDKDGDSGTASTIVTVNNLDPVASIDSITDETGAEIGIGKDVPAALVGLKVDVAGSFTDVGTLDTHTAVIDWGDGSTSAGTVTETDGSGSVTGTHVYNDPGDYTMTLTVTDDDHGEGTESADIKVVDAEGGIATVIEQLASLPDDPNIAAALDKLRGEKGGRASNGALDMLEKGDLNAALEKIKQALQYLEAAEAADPSLDLTNIKGLLALTAKSVAVDAIAQAEDIATRAKDLQKIEQANGLVEQGDTLLAALDHVGAVDKYQQALRKVQGML